MTANDGEKKLHIDEDWKEQVEKERTAAKAAREAGAESPAEDSPASAPESPAVETPSSSGAVDDPPLPEPNLATLANSLLAQALFALGQLPDDHGQIPPVRLNMARHMIDSIGVLEEKTRGNCTPEEAKMFAGILHELRLAYVAIESQAKKV